jgi:hypothetical protein
VKIGSEIDNTFYRIIADVVFGPYLSCLQRAILLLSQSAMEAVRADAGSVWLMKDHLLHRAVILNRPIDLLTSCSFTIDIRQDRSIGEAVRTCKPYLNNDAQNDTKIANIRFVRRENLETYIAYPILMGTICLGAFSFFRKEKKPFSQKDIEKLSMFGNLFGLLIHHCSFSPGLVDQWELIIKSLYNLLEDKEASSQPIIKNNHTPLWILKSSLPKGINPTTLAKIQQCLNSFNSSVGCTQLSMAIKISPSSVRRYLNYLHKGGFIKQEIVYLTTGRPMYVYSAYSKEIGASS